MPHTPLMIEPVGQRQARGVAAGRVVYDRMLAFAESLKTRGLLRGVESECPVAEWCTVEVRKLGLCWE